MRFTLTFSIAVLTAVPALAQDLASPGTEVKVGEAVAVPYSVPKGPEVPVEIMVTEVEKGALADLEGYDIPADLKDYIPYYVRYKWTNLSDEDLSHNSLSGVYVIDDRNQQQSNALAKGQPLEKCRSGGTARDMKKGVSAEGCEIYMIHKDGALKTVIYKGTNPDDKPAVKAIYADPIRWIVEGATASDAADTAQGKIVN